MAKTPNTKSLKKDAKRLTIYCAFDFPSRWKCNFPNINFIKRTPQDCPNAEIYLTLLSQPIQLEQLKQLPRLRFLGTYSVGTNHIDIRECKVRKIRVFNTPDVLTRATAELTIALLFAVARKISEAERFLRNGSFLKNNGWQPELFLGQVLYGKTAVIVGSGRIGRETGKLFLALGMKVFFITKKTPLEKILNLLKKADVLSFHCPLTPATRHWLDSQRIACLPSSAIVLNTSRGEVIDESALAIALEKKQIFGAGLDVFEQEPQVNRRLLRCKNAVLLPHIGSATESTRKAMFDLVVSSLATVFKEAESMANSTVKKRQQGKPKIKKGSSYGKNTRLHFENEVR